MKCEVRNVNGEFLRTLNFPLQTSKKVIDCHMATALPHARASAAAQVKIGGGVNKIEIHYSPTTMYEDYAISDTLFHWQSQSRTTDRSDTGQRYIHHKRLKHKILLFVREDRTNQGNLTEPYLFLGTADYVSHTGSRPMSITWQLHCPMPAHLLQRTTRLAVG